MSKVLHPATYYSRDRYIKQVLSLENYSTVLVNDVYRGEWKSVKYD